MTQKTFSDFIGKSQGNISSIFTGRTRVTIDIIEAIKNKFPEISTDWLLFGIGEMYASGGELSDGLSQNGSPTPSESQLPFAENEGIESVSENSKKSLQISPVEIVKNLDKPARKIKEIRVFYDDQTWETFSPTE